MKLSVTEILIVGYRFDNRDRQRQNDFYGEWLNRLNVQLTTWRITAAVRLDLALYFAKNDPADLARADVSDAAAAGQPTQGLFTTARDKYGVDLSSRYNTFYPSKIFVTYAQPGLDIWRFLHQVAWSRVVLAARKVDGNRRRHDDSRGEDRLQAERRRFGDSVRWRSQGLESTPRRRGHR